MQCISNICLLPRADGGNAIADGAPGQADADDTPGMDGDTSLADASLCSSGSQTIEASGAIVDFAVPPCVTSLTIEVFGAEGGGGSLAAVLGGKGARMKGDFAVNEGEVLKVLVGVGGLDGIEIGGVTTEQGGGTGGGGSFVVAINGDAMIIAGGGGGATHSSPGGFLLPGLDGGVGTSGGSPGGAVPGVGGDNGTGGGTNGNMGFHGGTGGGGFLTAGLSPSVGIAMWGTPNNPGSSYAEGGAGGIGGSKGRNGGFGGGGSSGFTGGGGGGYSGGGGGGTFTSGTPTGGGGGGSFNAGTNPDNSPGVRVGDGQVIMTWVAP
jgi:hypothetical protein